MCTQRPFFSQSGNELIPSWVSCLWDNHYETNFLLGTSMFPARFQRGLLSVRNAMILQSAEECFPFTLHLSAKFKHI
jgi:hypothetical protein